MRVRRRVLLLVTAALLLPLTGGTAAGAADGPTEPSVDVAGDGPGDLVQASAAGFRPGVDVTVTFDGATRSVPLATVAAAANGRVDLPAGTRTPVDATPGSYRVTMTQAGSSPVTSRPFDLVAPSVTFPATVIPGQPVAGAISGLSIGLAGLASTPDVTRTVTIDGLRVLSDWYTDGQAFLNPGVAFAAPSDLTVGNHRVTFTQTGPTPFTATGTVPVDAPVITVYGPTAPSGQVGASITDAGWADDFDVSVVGAAGDRQDGFRYTIEVNGGSRRVERDIDLDHLSPGIATITAVSRHNGATATGQFLVDGDAVAATGDLDPGRRIVSADGDVQLAMQSDGNLVFSNPVNRPQWSSQTSGHPGARLAVQPDGNVVVYDVHGRALWSTGTAGTGAGARLGFDTRHEPAVFTATGRQTWSTFVYGYGALTTVTAGHYLFKGEYLGANLANGRGSVRLTAQPDGNMVVGTTYGTVLWSTRTAGHPNAYLSLQTDGNLVVHAANGAVLWANSAHATGARLVGQSDGNVVEYAPNGTALWSTRTVVR